MTKIEEVLSMKKLSALLIFFILVVAYTAYAGNTEPYYESLEGIIDSEDFEEEYSVLKNSFNVPKNVGDKIRLDVICVLDSGNADLKLKNPSGEIAYSHNFSVNDNQKINEEIKSEEGKWTLEIFISEETEGKYRVTMNNDKDEES